MPAAEPAVDAPRVTAILVACNGAEWLPTVLASLERLRYPALEVVAVDNASADDSADLLRAHLGDDHVVALERNAGFGRAVAAALTGFESAQQADYLLLLHDDLVLAPTALRRMARALFEDPSLSIVGPKLREWKRERVLQQVGMTIDRLGRAESRLDPDELDQGQRDTQREVLYVSTAGMLLRRDVLAQVDGFDARYPAFRDDLDLCWRAWLAGLRVEVVPRAVGYHIGAASRAARTLATGRRWESRFLAERHSIATLVKNYGLVRLLWVLPALVLVGVVKTLAFVASRRFGDALATVLAWVWNLFQLPQTLRRRRRVQKRRVMSDGELARLFAPGLPRLREYNEALASWLAGGSTRALIDERDQPVDGLDAATGLRSALQWMREHAALTVGVVLLIAYAVGATSLLGRGQIVGGAVAPWPETTGAFWAAYATPWGGEPLASSAFASPLQAVLGLVSLLGFGSAWLAQRVAVLGLVPLTYAVAVRAGRLVSPRVGPRVLGATLYVLSPPVLGALAQGRYGALVVAALLPGLLLLGVRAADAGAPSAGGWRATALLALGLAVAAAADADLLPLVALLWLAGVVASLAAPRAGRLTGTLRLLGAGAAAAALLLPWVIDLVRSGALSGWLDVTVDVQAEALPLWRALGLAPALLPGLEGAGGLVVAATVAAVAVAAALLGMRRQPVAVAGLLLAWAFAATAAWGLAAAAVEPVWPPAFLLVAALAHAGLAVLAAHRLGSALAGHAFGLRHVATGLLAIVVLTGVGAGVWRVASDPWHDLRREPELLPAFVAAEDERVGPYRVVLLHAEPGGTVRWDVTDADGPSMLSYGTIADGELLAHLDTAVGGLVSGAAPGAGQALGLVNVRYVVISGADGTDDLVAALSQQPAMEPVPGGAGRVWRVQTWLPRATVLPEGRAEALLTGQDPGDLAEFEEDGLREVRTGRYAGGNPHREGGLLVLAEGADPAWRAAGDGRSLERATLDGMLVNAFEVPENVTRVAVELRGAGLHALLVGAQLLLALALLSLALRPPRAAQGRTVAGERALPDTLEAPSDDTDPDLPITVPPGPDEGQRDG